MPRFSRRSWNLLNGHDRRLVVAMASYELALRRFRTSHAWVTRTGQIEFRLQLLDALTEMRDAVRELRGFQRVAFRGTQPSKRRLSINK